MPWWRCTARRSLPEQPDFQFARNGRAARQQHMVSRGITSGRRLFLWLKYNTWCYNVRHQGPHRLPFKWNPQGFKSDWLINTSFYLNNLCNQVIVREWMNPCIIRFSKETPSIKTKQRLILSISVPTTKMEKTQKNKKKKQVINHLSNSRFCTQLENGQKG